MRKIRMVATLFLIAILMNGCGGYHYETKFNDHFLADAKPGHPIKSIKIPADISQNHVNNLWEMFWESENTIYIVMQDRKSGYVYSAPDYGVYIVDIEKEKVSRLSDAEREDFIFRLKNRFRFFETEPEGKISKTAKILGTVSYFLGVKKAKHTKMYEGQIRYGDVSMDVSEEITFQEEGAYTSATSKMTLTNNLTNKKNTIKEHAVRNSNCIGEGDFRKTQISPDGRYYLLCGGEILKTDETAVKPLFITEELKGKGYEDKIKGRYFVHKFGDKFFTFFNPWVAQFNPKWDKIAFLNYYSHGKANEGFTIEIYPANFYLRR